MNQPQDQKHPRLYNDAEWKIIQRNWYSFLVNTRVCAPALMEQLEMTYGRPSRKEGGHTKS